MSTSADAVIRWIENNYLGKGEPFPPKYGEWIPFQERWGYPPSVMVEWCGGLLCEAVVQTGGTIGSGVNDTAPNTWWTVAGVQRFMQRGDWIPADGTTQPQRGDWIYFDWQGGGWLNPGDLQGANRVDHVGIVTDSSRWNAANNWRIDTIEGNVNERCGRFIRYDNPQVVGFGRPRYNLSIPKPVQPAGHSVATEFSAKYAAVDGARTLGKPTTGRVPFFGNTEVMSQSFERGILIENGEQFAVYGAIYQKWTAGEGARLGLPTSDEMSVDGLPDGRMNTFEKGVIAWTPADGARILDGNIGQWWLSVNPQLKLALGAPKSDVVKVQPNDGTAAQFANGWLVYTHGFGVYPVLGQIANIYNNRGTMGLGYPTNSASVGEDGVVSQSFTNGVVLVPKL